MRKVFPWYDSVWLSVYITAQNIIEKTNPKKLKSFIEAFEPLKTCEDFEVIKLKNVF